MTTKREPLQIVAEHDRVLPHSIDAERATLGSVLIAPARWYVAASAVSSDDFFRHAHGLIFDALLALAQEGVPPDLIPLTDRLRTSGKLEDVGGQAYLASLIDGVPTSTNVEHYAAIVREKARLRRMIEVAQTLESRAYAGDEPAAVLTDGAIRELSLTVDVGGGGLVSATEAIDEYVRDLEAGTLGTPVPSGFLDLDAMTGGFRPANLVIVAGRPSTGKTAWALCAADHMSAKDHRAVFFSLEMSQRELAARLLAIRSGVPTSRLERYETTDAEYRAVSEALGYQTSLHIESSARTLTEIGAWCRRAQAAGGLSCAVVDYLQLMIPERHRDSEESEISAISRGLKRIAKDLGIVVVALSQLNRAPEARRDKRPQMSDLRGSGAMEQDCDVGVLLFRPEMHAPKPENAGIAEVIVAKQRNGPTGVVRLQFEKEVACFRNLESGVGDV